MAFVQVQQSLMSHRKTLRLARLLGLDRYAVVGRLVALWTWCLDNALTGCLGDDIDADVLADVMAWEGRPAELLEALLTSGFLEVDPTDDRIHIHDWHEHMGRLIERREADADRQRRRRARLSGLASAPDADADTMDAADVTDDEALPVKRMSHGCHADVTRTSRGRVEKSRVEQSTDTSEDSGSPKRERAHDRHDEAAGAALSLVTPAPTMADPPATPSATAATSPSSNPANPASKRATSAKVTPLPTSSSSVTTARVRDPVWDACIAAMGAAPSNRVERGRWATGIKALKESLSAAAPPGSPITEAIAAEIHVRAQRYRTRFGTSVPLNPMALAGNWTTLAHDVPAVQEDQRHGNFAQSRSGQHTGSGHSGYAAYGRRDGRRDGRPAVGTPAYYAQAAAAQAAAAQRANTDTGGASGQGGYAPAAHAVGEW